MALITRRNDPATLKQPATRKTQPDINGEIMLIEAAGELKFQASPTRGRVSYAGCLLTVKDCLAGSQSAGIASEAIASRAVDKTFFTHSRDKLCEMN